MVSSLVERFKLVAHHESRENPSYEVVIDKGGRKFKEAPPEADTIAKTPLKRPHLLLPFRWVDFLGGAGNTVPAPSSDPTAFMFQSIQQLGLKLQPLKAPVDTIVIDHLEKTPIDN